MNIKYTSNLQSVINSLESKINELQSDKLLRTAAFDAQAIVQERVQQGGSGVSNSLGDYSPGYAKKRRKTGRQVSYKDFTMEGDLWRNWQVEGSGKSYAVGFATKREADKAEYLEAYNGGPIFELSNSELSQVQEGIENTVKQILK